MLKKVLLAVFVVMLPVTALAASVQSGSELKIDKNLKNAYLFANKINVDSDLSSDLVVMGNEIKLNNKIENDLLAAGANIEITGEVGKNARVAGAKLRQTGRVGEDLLAFFGTGEIKNSEITGDLIVLAGEASIDGSVGGKTQIGAGTLKLAGNYLGDVNVKADSLEILDNTNIKGKLIFEGPSPAKISSTSKIDGGSEFIVKKAKATGLNNLLTTSGAFSLIQSMLALIIITLILTSVLKKYSNNVIESIEKSVPLSALYGIVTLVVAPIIILICIISIVGSIIGSLVLVAYILSLIMAYCYSTIYIGKLFVRLIGRLDEKSGYWSCVIGSVLTVLISIIPYVGSFVIFIFFIIGLGGVIKQMIESARSQNGESDGK